MHVCWFLDGLEMFLSVVFHDFLTKEGAFWGWQGSSRYLVCRSVVLSLKNA